MGDIHRRIKKQTKETVHDSKYAQDGESEDGSKLDETLFNLLKENPKHEIATKSFKSSLYILTIFSFITRFWCIDYPNQVVYEVLLSLISDLMKYTLESTLANISRENISLMSIHLLVNWFLQL